VQAGQPWKGNAAAPPDHRWVQHCNPWSRAREAQGRRLRGCTEGSAGLHLASYWTSVSIVHFISCCNQLHCCISYRRQSSSPHGLHLPSALGLVSGSMWGSMWASLRSRSWVSLSTCSSRNSLSKEGKKKLYHRIGIVYWSFIHLVHLLWWYWITLRNSFIFRQQQRFCAWAGLWAIQCLIPSSFPVEVNWQRCAVPQ
jgi:hypothetical protein